MVFLFLMGEVTFLMKLFYYLTKTLDQYTRGFSQIMWIILKSNLPSYIPTREVLISSEP